MNRFIELHDFYIAENKAQARILVNVDKIVALLPDSVSEELEDRELKKECCFVRTEDKGFRVAETYEEVKKMLSEDK